jgi:putative sterol carrier protein
VTESFVEYMEARGEELNNDPDKRDDIEALEGEVIQLITEEGDTYKIIVKESKLQRAHDDDKPTIFLESNEQVVLDIAKGKLDPLEVLNTRKLMAKTDAVRGRLMRRLFYGEDF